jgi:UDP-N-acetylmuramyl-tripeptide synthetase/amino acid carrier protein
MYTIENVINSISDFLWGWPLVVGILAVSIIMTVVFKWVQVRYFWQSWYYVFHPSEKTVAGAEYITPFQAFLNTLSASLGNGSAAGMATAIASGGPGAAFWIFIVGFFGIALRFAEVYASSYFMDENKQGTFRGGPMVYLQLVPGKKYLPSLYAFFCLLTSFVAGSAMQCNSMTIGIERLTGFGKPLIAVILFIAMVYVLYGGAQRIISFSEKIIPVKVGLFFICTLALLVYHAPAIPAALALILKYAFTWQAVAGAGVGYTVQTALRYGISRSVSATELGLGTAGILFGTTGGKEPFKNSIMSMASLMISNHLVCCLLLLIFVASGVWDSGLTSTALTSAAFETLFGIYGKIIVTFLSISFGLGVLVAYAYIGRECWLFLMPRLSTQWYTAIYAGMSFFGIFSTVAVVWSAVDIANAGMLIMNLYGLVMLLPLLIKAFNVDERKRKPVAENTVTSKKLPSHYKVAAHTDNVGSGSTFVAIPGTKKDGTEFIKEALKRGATTIVLDQNAQLSVDLQQALARVASYRVENTRQALAELSAYAYNYPARKLKFIAVTGTKGKTTTTYLLEHILKTAGFKTARLSTVSNAILSQEYETQLTTQQPDYIHMFLNECVKQGVEWVVIEVAAQALSMHRVFGIEFDAVVFTNFSQEHAEFYATQQDYFAAKAAIFKQLKKNGIVVLNGDDSLVSSLRSLCSQAQLSSLKDVTVIGASRAGVSCYIDQLVFENTHLLGTFNLHNIHMAYLVARSLNILPEVIQQAVSTFTGVPGRLNKYALDRDIVAYIDYAHTPSSMKAVLSTLRSETEQLIVVFGAGGERDPVKRPFMGGLAVEYADIVILTTDNPRSEEPEKIMQDILSGIPENMMHKVTIEYDRAAAIRYAYSVAQPGAIIALLGKGPDEYQLVQGTKHYFSEREILKSL